MKSCSFFGHRDTPQTEELKERVREIVERLIVEENVNTFLFGSRSKFDDLCHIVVTELKKKYPYIRRVAYPCKHEFACLVGAGVSLTRKIKEITGQDVQVKEYEEIKKSDRVDSAGRAAYVERNYEIIDNSNYCVFYYKLDCQPPKRKYSKRSVGDYQPKSGTAVAYEYAWGRKRSSKLVSIVNVWAILSEID